MPEQAYVTAKRCSVCRIEKPLDEFMVDRKRKLGRGCRCKACDSKRSRDYYKKGKGLKGPATAAAEAWRREERAPSPIQILDCGQCCQPFVALRDGRRLTYCGDECRAEARRRTERDRQRVYDPAKDRNTRHRRRAQSKQTDLTTADIRGLLANRTFCPLCRKRMSEDHRHPHAKHLDHIVPLAIGGTHSWGNVRVICRTCNISRPHDGSDISGQVTLWAQDMHAVPAKPARIPRAKPQRTRQQIQAERERRAKDAIEMRLSGATWQQIADTLGYGSTGAAFNAVHGNSGTQKPSANAALLTKRQYAKAA